MSALSRTSSHQSLEELSHYTGSSDEPSDDDVRGEISGRSVSRIPVNDFVPEAEMVVLESKDGPRNMAMTEGKDPRHVSKEMVKHHRKS